MAEISFSTFALLALLFVMGVCLALLLPAAKAKKTQHDSSKSQVDTAARNAPFSIWVEQCGTVIWSNEFCSQQFSKMQGGFLGMSNFRARKGRYNTDDTGVYELLHPINEIAQTYSISSQKMGSQTVFYAQDATPLTAVEAELKRFIQTLTATFAHLPIGLAVFDKQHDLSLFNPALSNLLGVPPDWLARRPSMRAFLDRLRNDGAIPEPKDFAALRQEFEDLESGANTGPYEVEWTLPSGQIYRVTGRPHLEGGAALLVEDISKASAIESEYRAEFRQLYATLEALSDAVAIFDQAGELIFANDAFDGLWGENLSTSVAPITASEASRIFQRKCKPNPVWGEMRNFVHDPSERCQWQADAQLLTGEDLKMTFSPLPEGRVLCEFRQPERANRVALSRPEKTTLRSA